MTPGIKPLVAGNWKMNGLKTHLGELEAMANGLSSQLTEKIDALICTPATLIVPAVEIASGSPLSIGGQDCHENASGAHTGDVSAHMLVDAGCSFVIVGHSERRTDHAETNELVCAKAEAAITAGLNAIICIGESEEERKTGKTLDVLGNQLSGSLPSAHSDEILIAYEPVWAIGTGMVPSKDDVKEAHAFIRSHLIKRYGEGGNKVRILYGGSVKPSNALELMSIENVDGALVGGASLKSEDFLGICAAYLAI